ncbi:MAG TPA: ribonuclease HI [Candidatus Faecalibacterium faecigallinarum]|uniref:Ribonuclease H n=1 Tax=Candidatus Faecalibacterium faecigallinarum TaxID=2838577 RepID=A0A9D2P9B8_9FIRM|nr:ribonuclease HI [Candidatus Faecalibacterium faecigallinarum]
MKKVEIYTDGACSGNPGPGGWGAVLRYRSTDGQVYEKELSGGDASTTNNRMELTAFIEAVGLLKEPCEIRYCSDSQYVINGLEKGWAKGWRARGWKKADKSPALNPDLWAKALDLAEQHRITYVWVKGHAGHPENERCDQLAVAQSKAHGGRQN